MRNGFDDLYDIDAFVDVGGSHLRRRFNCQDHAVVMGCDQGLVLCVADGVSVVGGELSSAEAGAWLAAELATRGAIEALQRGAEPGGVLLEVANYLARGLGPIAGLLGRRSDIGLSSTLLLMVLTPRWTYAWGSGDGHWGVTLPPGLAPGPHPANKTLLRAAASLAGSRPTEWQGGRHSDVLFKLATTSAASGVDAIMAQLEPLLVIEGGPALGGYVATDGLRHEPASALLLGQPGAAWREALIRSYDADDLGIARASRRSLQGFALSNPFSARAAGVA